MFYYCDNLQRTVYKYKFYILIAGTLYFSFVAFLKKEVHKVQYFVNI